jgi:small subunit ribosomal protein S17
MPRRVLQGLVVSDKMDKTVTVLVERRVMHQKYKKYVKKSSKYAAHDEANVCKAGDTVSIEECRPISKNKSWKVIEGVSKGKKLTIAPFDSATRVKGPAEAPKTAKVKLAVKKEKPAADKEKAAKKPAPKASK